MKKRTGLLSLIFCLLLSVTALATDDIDFTYSGPLDGETGLPMLDEDGEVDTSNQTRFELDKGVYAYDSTRDGYAIYVGYSEFYSNVPPGIVTTGELRFTIPNGLTATLYRNGNKLSSPDFSYIRTVGSYALEVTSTDLKDSTIVYFTVVPSLTAAVTTYNLPAGFEVGSLYYEEEEQLYTDASSVQFTDDGVYKLTIVAPTADEYITLNLDVDHTAPTIIANGVENGQANGVVNLSSDDGTAAFVITLTNGTSVSNVTDLELTEPGLYHITLTDEAGNVSTLDFELLLYLNSYAICVVALIFVGMITLWMHLAFRKKHTRVG